LTQNLTAQARAAHRPRLLIQWEPAHRVFLSNLADAFLFRSAQRLPTTTTPAPFWNDVFVSTGVGWGAFLESMLWHTLTILAVWTLSQQPSLQPMQRHSDTLQASYVSYSRSPLSFPARGSSPRNRSQRLGGRSLAGRKSVIAVAPERKHAVISAPQMGLTLPGRPGIMVANAALPMMPLSATRHSQLTLPPSQDWVVPPAPAVSQHTSRWTGLAQVSVIAPPPNVAAGRTLAGIAPPSLAAVAPPPNVQRGSLRIGDINIGHSEVVAPAPQLPMHEQSAIPGIAQGTLGNTSVVPPPPSSAGLGRFGNGRGAVLARAGLAVVPPSPTLQGIGNSAGNGGGASLSHAGGVALPGSGLPVVPPPPTVQGAGRAAGGVSGSGLSRVGFSVVPPPPAVQGLGGSAGRGRGTGSALSGSGLPVVPPPPGFQALAGSSGGGRGNSLSGTGFSVVPPPPSVQGMGSSAGRGRGNGLSSPGLSDVAPGPSPQQGSNSDAGASGGNPSNGAPTTGASAASIQGAGNAAPGERLMAMDVHPAVTPLPPLPPLVVENPRTPAEELPLRVIGLALALPNSSYFSNYEVYFAERSLGKGELELIKLVYVFLPYQQRLSEYRLDDSKVYKVRVTRDPSCDESLMQMTWPEGESPAQPQQANEIPASTHSSRNDILSCYRTTADDYRKAVSRPARPAKIRAESKPGS
jgi:hypothetical protein